MASLRKLNGTPTMDDVGRDPALGWALVARSIRIGRGSRPYDLVTVARILDVLRDKEKLSNEEMGELLGVSGGMISQFLAVLKLAPDVQKLFEKRAIDSVQIAFALAKISDQALQRALAQLVVDGDLRGEDLRSVVWLIKQKPEVTLDEAVGRVSQARPKKLHMIVLVVPMEDLIHSLTPQEIAHLAQVFQEGLQTRYKVHAKCIVRHPYLLCLLTMTEYRKLTRIAGDDVILALTTDITKIVTH